MENETGQNLIDKKSFKWKYKLAAVLIFLFITSALVYILFIQESKPDPNSDKIIRQIASMTLSADSIYYKPENLTDEDFASIEVLWLSGTELSDIKLIGKFTHMKELIITDIQFSESKIPRWIKFLAKYGIVNLDKRYSLDLHPLEKLSDLEKLIVADAPINNLKPLSKLKNLKQISIANKEISDLEPLKELKNLESLFIGNCPNITDQQVKDLQKALPNLKIQR